MEYGFKEVALNVWMRCIKDIVFLRDTLGYWVIFYSLFLVTWVYTSSWLFYHYDGALMAAHSRLMFDWATPFEIDPLNPYNAMGGSFLAINPWWSPGALALSWFDEWRFAELLSMSIFWISIALSGYLMFRALRLPPVYAMTGVMIGLLLNFPLYSLLVYQLPGPLIWALQ